MWGQKSREEAYSCYSGKEKGVTLMATPDEQQSQRLAFPQSDAHNSTSRSPIGDSDRSSLPGQATEKTNAVTKLPRKPRRDKGRIMATQRDLAALAWIAHQYAARLDHIQHFLSLFPDPQNPFKTPGMIAASTTKEHVDRWRQAGWVDYDRLLAKGPGYAWITKKGLDLVALNEVYKARRPAATRLNHIYAVNQVWFLLLTHKDADRFTWQSERNYRANVHKGPYPDAVLITGQSTQIAIEVEITQKKPADLSQKLYRLVDASYEDELFGRIQQTFFKVWIYVPNEAIQAAVEEAREDLTEGDQARISVAITPQLIP
jgi:hypothetical protein